MCTLWGADNLIIEHSILCVSEKSYVTQWNRCTRTGYKRFSRPRRWPSSTKLHFILYIKLLYRLSYPCIMSPTPMYRQWSDIDNRTSGNIEWIGMTFPCTRFFYIYIGERQACIERGRERTHRAHPMGRYRSKYITWFACWMDLCTNGIK